MKRIITTILTTVFICLAVFAQQQQTRHFAEIRKNYAGNKHSNTFNENTQERFGKFDPARYQRDLEAFITKEARLTPQEAQAFFPLYRELQAKQRAIYMKQKKLDKAMFIDNKVAMEAIRNHDAQEIEIKKLQQTYHNRFLKVIPATKVLICIHAEERFNRNMMRNMAKHK